MNNKTLKILIVTQYFWPENMRINDLVEGFLEKGHEVTVLTSFPNYPEGKLYSEYKKDKQAFSNYKGAMIIRVPMLLRGKSRFKLILNYLSFFSSASTIGLLKLRGVRFDSIFVYAVSPIMVAIPAIIIGRLKNAPVFLWVLDLWPETLSAVGAIKNKFILGFVGRLVSYIYNRTDYILLQSKSFKSNVLNYCTRPIEEDRLVYFPSWAEDILVNVKQVTKSKFLNRDNRFFTIMFAGNIGEAQDFPTILDAFEQLKDQPFIRLVIVGDGRMLPWVADEVRKRTLNNVLLLGRHPVNEMPGLFSCADALLISLKKNDVFSKVIPAKLQAYLACGKPIIGMIDGEAAHVIEQSGSGFVSSPGDDSSLIKNIHKVYRLSLEDREFIGDQGTLYYKEHFQAQQLFNRLESIFKSGTIREQVS